MSTEARVTVAVVSWNTHALLAACLESLSADAASGLADVWVVDNASKDDSPEMVRERFGWANLVASDENLGFGRAVNLVAGRTTAPWVAPANADIRVTPGALSRLLAAGEDDPGAAVIAPRLLLPDGSTQHSAYPFPTVLFTLGHALGMSGLPGVSERWCLPPGWDPDLGRRVPWAIGAFLIVRRSAWTQVGGFDAEQWMYAEDLDLGWRLHRAGWTTRFEPGAAVHHEESAAVKQAWGEDRNTRWHVSTYAWMLRRRGAPVTRLVAALNVAGFAARAALFTAPALAGSSRARAARAGAIRALRAHAQGLSRRERLERHR